MDKRQLIYAHYDQILNTSPRLNQRIKFPIHYGKSTHHCHTKRSDGKNTAQEMIEAAISKGFSQIGISDHINVHPSLASKEIVWTMPFEEVPSYVEELLILREKYKNKIEVRIGAEVDFFPNFTHNIVSKLRVYPFDYLIGSVHMLGVESVDGCYKEWANFSQKEIDEHYLLYWKTLYEMVESGLFDIVAHMDLPKKFAHYPSPEMAIKLDPLIVSILKRIKEKEMWVEINTAGVKLPCKDFYPRESILRTCHEFNIPILMNDDSHSTSDLGQFFTHF